MSEQKKPLTELFLVEELVLGEIIEMEYPDFPVLGSTGLLVPLFVSYQDPEGKIEKLGLALPLAKLRELGAQVLDRLGEQKSEGEPRH